MLPESAELTSILRTADEIAEQLQQPLTSAHVLLCLFTVENQAARFLKERGLTLEALMEGINTAPSEPPSVWERIQRRARDTAGIHRAAQLETLHLLVALCSFVDSAAYGLVDSFGVAMAEIRTSIMAHLHEQGSSHLQAYAHALKAPIPPPPPASPYVGGMQAALAPTAPRVDPAPVKAVSIAGTDPKSFAERFKEQKKAMPTPPDSEAVKQPRRASVSSQRIEPLLAPDMLPPAAIKLRQQRSQVQSETSSQPAVAPDTTSKAKPAPVAQPQVKVAPRVVPRFNPHAYALSRTDFPLLSKVGRNLSQEAIEGRIDQAIGRDSIIVSLIDTLNKRRSNNPLLVGEPGVGKTAVVEGFAWELIRAAKEGEYTGLEERIIVAIEASAMLAGTSLRGAFAERMNQLKTEVRKANGKVIVFFDELHHWIGAGGSNDGGGDAAGDLKTALARGEFPCIGATTWNEYAKYIEPDSAFTRRFETIRVQEPDLDATIEIIEGVAHQYEAHHGVTIDRDAIEHAVKLAHRYLPNRRNPDKSFGVIDLAGSLARRSKSTALTTECVARAIAEQAGIEPERLLMGDRERFARLPELLREQIVGQDEAVQKASAILQRNYAGFAAGRPIGSFLFLGPTGVGKTEFAKALAKILFHDENAMLRLDMSEYMEAHSVARMIGAPPGYVGHDAAGQLTEPVRRSPWQLVLLDEIEKAHPDVLNVLIQLLDDGRLTDSRGNTVDFRNTIIVMTSNLGAEVLAQTNATRQVGFAAAAKPSHEQVSSEATKIARKHFRPELWNRIDEIIVFPALDAEQVRAIAHRLIQGSAERLERDRGIVYTVSEDVISHLLSNGGFDPSMGARPMRRTIERLVETPIAAEILKGDIRRGDRLSLTIVDGLIDIRKVECSEEHDQRSDD